MTSSKIKEAAENLIESTEFIAPRAKVTKWDGLWCLTTSKAKKSGPELLKDIMIIQTDYQNLCEAIYESLDENLKDTMLKAMTW